MLTYPQGLGTAGDVRVEDVGGLQVAMHNLREAEADVEPLDEKVELVSQQFVFITRNSSGQILFLDNLVVREYNSWLRIVMMLWCIMAVSSDI